MAIDVWSQSVSTVSRQQQLLIYTTRHDSAVDHKQVSSDKACGIGGKEHGRACEFVKSAKTFHRRTRQEFSPALCTIEQRGIHVCAQHTWDQRIDTYSEFRPLDGERLGQGRDRALACTICCYLIKPNERG